MIRIDFKVNKIHFGKARNFLNRTIKFDIVH